MIVNRVELSMWRRTAKNDFIEALPTLTQAAS
jgi:hypothetical protein